MNLLALAQNAQKLYQAITTGEIAEMLTDNDLAAARDAFRKVQLAEDREAQIWSAVNHLESAHSKLLSLCHNKRAYISSTNQFLRRMEEKDRYVLCVMACCYFVLQEKKLCLETLEMAEAIPERGRKPAPLIVEAVNPLFWREMGLLIFGSQDCYFDMKQVKELKSLLLPA